MTAERAIDEIGDDALARILRRINASIDATAEKAQQRFYRTCADGWTIAYTTSPTVNGPDAGRFVVLAYKPVGEGSRGGKRTAQEWKLVYRRAFAKRRSAKAQAEKLWWKHERAGKERTS